MRFAENLSINAVKAGSGSKVILLLTIGLIIHNIVLFRTKPKKDKGKIKKSAFDQALRLALSHSCQANIRFIRFLLAMFHSAQIPGVALHQDNTQVESGVP